MCIRDSVLGEESTVWLSKYRSLIVLEALLSRNTDYSVKMKSFEKEFSERVRGVCNGYSFSQKSHSELVRKVKESVIKLIEGDQEDNSANKGFDFGKMNEMMSKMEKEKTSKNGNFMEKMNMIKKKSKKNKTDVQPSDDMDDLLDLNIGGNTTKPNTESGDLLMNMNSKPAPTNNDLFDLDFGVSSNTNQMDVSNNCLLYTSPSPRDATLSRMPSSA